MFDFNNLDFDLNADGIPDADGEFAGVDDAGAFDVTLFDMDGDGIPDTGGYDSNGDGIIDTYHAELDTDDDGIIDTIVEGNDYDQDGMIESQTVYHDYDGDHTYEEVVKLYDSDHDEMIDEITTSHDFDEDGNEDVIVREQFLDRDGTGQIDTYVVSTDVDGDHVFEAVEVYDYDPATGVIELQPVAEEQIGNIAGAYVDDLDNFNPAEADMSRVSGDPVHAMQEWEYQGDTGRCALYSQKFVIEELTHQEIDIEELAELAEKKGWFSEESGTPLLNMDKALGYFGIHSEMSFHNDIADLERCLRSGGKVIVAIDADEIWYGEEDDLFTPGDGPNHAVEVIGVDRTNPDEPMVILNDSGNPRGCGEMVPLETFADAWEDGNCQMIYCR